MHLTEQDVCNPNDDDISRTKSLVRVVFFKTRTHR